MFAEQNDGAPNDEPRGGIQRTETFTGNEQGNDYQEPNNA
jgi:hypothetical protein